ncbi:MAG TPA: hypothetical protein VKN76_15105 [Kiloniellaceae bacterium]|nr:hypothetical protein [Kiloniellaceae bacterium]
MAKTALLEILRSETAPPPSPALQALTDAARARHGDSVEAVLFYGSCLRDGIDDSKMADLYLLVRDYRSALGNPLAALGNRLLPPNVYYLECRHEGLTLKAKYAVLTLDVFGKGTSAAWFHPYLWARFAQPTAIAYCAGEKTRDRILAGLAGAVETLLGEAAPLMDAAFRGEDLWVEAFQRTYRSELRAEGPERARVIFQADAARYLAVTGSLFAAEEADTDGEGQTRWFSQPQPSRAARRRAALRWLLRRPWGKLLSVLRLIKAAFTFQGGAGYLKWKIERHAGVEVELTPWQARHPILAAPLLLWRLYRQGAIR